MKTAFQQGPGMYAVATNQSNRRIPHNVARTYCVRLEAYDLGKDDGRDDLSFQILFAQAEGNPEIAKALLLLGDAIKSNAAMLKIESEK